MDESSPKKKKSFMQKKIKKASTDNSMEICQSCFGETKIFNGDDFILCNLCKGKGEVNENINSYFLGNLTEEFLDTE